MITTGATNYIDRATKMARAMVTRYGMSDKYGMMALETVNPTPNVITDMNSTKAPVNSNHILFTLVGK